MAIAATATSIARALRPAARATTAGRRCAGRSPICRALESRREVVPGVIGGKYIRSAAVRSGRGHGSGAVASYSKLCGA